MKYLKSFDSYEFENIKLPETVTLENLIFYGSDGKDIITAYPIK